MFEKYRKEIIILSLFIIIPLIGIGLYYVFRSPVRNKSSKSGNMPYIDIKGSEVDAVNDYINKIYKDYSSSDKTKISYKVNNYKNIVSVLIEINEFREDIDDYVMQFIGFNINKDGSYIDKENLANLFNYDLVDVVDKVENRLNNFYEEEIDEGYVDPYECSFNCYLSYARGINNILDETSLVVENNKLVAYINLSKDDVNSDKKFFDKINNPYKIILE